MACFGYEQIYNPDTGDLDREYYETSEKPCKHYDCDEVEQS